MIPLARSAAAHLPNAWKARLKRLVIGRANPYLHAVTDVGAVLDIYVWIADGELDTLLRLENYFSPFFPDLDTSTTATVELYDCNGALLGTHTQTVPHFAAPAIRVSDLIEQCRRDLVGRTEGFGNILWYLLPPESVVKEIRALDDPLLFWDRGYIGYIGRQGQIAYVHGVDKAVARLHDGRRLPWPIPDESYVACPEIPVEFSEYTSIEFLLQNRAPGSRRFTLEVIDRSGRTHSRHADIGSFGVRRIELAPASLCDLELDAPLRVRVAGLPTRYGRPIVLKRFPSGAFSLMHC